MSYSLPVCRLLAVLMPFGLLGCGNSGPPPVVPDLPDASAVSKAMELYDANHDGFLDAKELKRAPGLKAAVKQVDTDHDGKISADEIAQRIKSWADSQLARSPVSCRVTRKGKPLAGAEVVFTPESFLGRAIKAGRGTTNAQGYAQISAPYPQDMSIQGLAPGFYRVEVTKDGENVPAMYNTQTSLGAEVAFDSEAMRKGMYFDLEY